MVTLRFLCAVILLLFLPYGSTEHDPAKPNAPVPAQGIFSLESDGFRESNASIPGPETIGAVASRKGTHFYDHIFKRQDEICWTDAVSWHGCGDLRCCRGLGSNGEGGWCCGIDAACATGTDTFCTYPTVTETWTTTEVTTTTEGSTVSSSVAETTEWYYDTTTEIEVVTVSNIDTITEVSYFTVTPNAGRHARRRAAAFQSTGQAVVRSMPIPTATSVERSQQQLVTPPKITSPPRIELRRFFRRQDGVSTSTYTVWVTETQVETTSEDYTTTVYYTETSTSTNTVTSTFTSAPDASTTVYETSTVTKDVVTVSWSPTPGPTPEATPESSPEPTPSAAGAGSGGATNLTKAEQAGIGAGTGAGCLVICLILGFCWRRRRNKKAEEAQTFNDNVPEALSGGEKQPPPPGPGKPPMATVFPAPTSSSPPPSDRYSDMIPAYASYNSGHTSPTLVHPQYPHPVGTPSSGYELSATPGVQQQYQYPRPPSPGQGGNAYRMSHGASPVEMQEASAGYQYPVAEMYHPVPVEIPSVYSPEPRHSVPYEGHSR